MNIIQKMAVPLRKIAVPCGIIGCIYIILLSAFAFLATPKTLVTNVTARDGSGQIIKNLTESAPANNNSTFLIFMGILFTIGLLTIIAILSLKKRPTLRNTLIWISIASTFVLGLLSFGPLILPATVLLVLAAIGLGKGGNQLEQRNES